ncbi:MAG: VOC family protein, partial [Actinobacteria bacterium]|nr:VOC family protein [Actinomycetota bacterium]
MSIRTQRIGHVTLIGSNEADTVAFYQGVLGMPLVLRQPNLDEPATLHLFFDAGNGSYLTFFVQAERASDGTPVPWAVGSVHHVAFDVTPEVFERALTGLRAHGIAH